MWSLIFLSMAAASQKVDVRTALGTVRGNGFPIFQEFLGIPYGTAERFEPAVPRSKGFDQNPLEATYFGPACLQTLTNVTTYGSEYSCHVLNIWRPAGVGPGANLPVMLFVPGGTNDFGEAEPYNASIMASDQHAVICSINYRVGPFGFVALKEQALAGEPTGNFALTDIQAALRFLRQHVADFGGDPKRLTLFGQSSGGGLVLLHTVLPSSSGLLEGVISQSGDLGARPLDKSLGVTETLAERLNCTQKGFKSTRACLLAATGDELVYAQGVTCITPNVCNAATSWSPTVDGVLLPDDPLALAKAGQVNPLAVALGANTNDSYLFIMNTGPIGRTEYEAALIAAARGNVTLASALIALYPPRDNRTDDHVDLMGWWSSDRMLCGLRRTAAAFAAAPPTKGQVHLYRYNYFFQSNRVCTAASNWHDPSWGSVHQDEVSFVFGQPIFMNIGYTNCSVPGWSGFDRSCLDCHFNTTEAAFARAVGRLWTSFAASGDPGVREGIERGEVQEAANAEWPRFGAGGRNVLLHPQHTQPAGAPQRMQAEFALGRPAYCEVWDEVDADA